MKRRCPLETDEGGRRAQDGDGPRPIGCGTNATGWKNCFLCKFWSLFGGAVALN